MMPIKNMIRSKSWTSKNETDANKFHWNREHPVSRKPSHSRSRLPSIDEKIPETVTDTPQNNSDLPLSKEVTITHGSEEAAAPESVSHTRELRDSKVDISTGQPSLLRRASLQNVSLLHSPASSSQNQKNKDASFRKVGCKVATLVRTKNAFQRLNQLQKLNDSDDSVEDSDMFEIKEMPKQPRFASTLSVEAQYAMMKGYEDIVYSHLSTSYPECCSTLRRNRTPITGVVVKTAEKDKPRETVISSRAAVKDAQLTPVLHGGSNKVTKLFPKSDVKVAGTRYEYNRSKSFPHIVPVDRQLVLTYRYQSAMDILDGMRKDEGGHVLSPRVKTSRCAAAPVKEFNSWARVWSKEFESNSKRTKTQHE